MARRSSGLASVVAEIQRHQQRQRRQQAAAQRSAAAAQRQQAQAREQAYRAAQREAARGQKAALVAYQQSREAEVATRNSGIEALVHDLRSVLKTGLTAPAFSWQLMCPPIQIPPFDPGHLGRPIAMPDGRYYQVPPLSGLQALSPGAKRQHEAQVAEARARFEYDWQQAQAAEADRWRRLSEYHQQFTTWAAEEQRRSAARDAEVHALWCQVGAGDGEAVRQYFSAALLHTASTWPVGFPCQFALAYDTTARQLVINWELPSVDIVPETARIRYFKTDDRESEISRPPTERRNLHREVLAQSGLRVVADLFRADDQGVLQSIALNGYVTALSPATGNESETFLLTLTCRRDQFNALALDRVEAVSCLHGLHGQLSGRPDRLEAVRQGRQPDSVGGTLAESGTDHEEDTDLFDMDPIEFEELLAELFRRRGLQVTTTKRSGDQGVDVLAIDPDPVTGGQIVIQAKRYRNTVSPDAVRDLWGTVDHHGAAKGILVTTAGFGPGSHEFARDKRLTLIDGPQLVELLQEVGLSGHLGPR
ncbi:restriction system protein [Streptacidiphilus jiangxiensis]|uniref:Restriction system protein n=1 Tax=Streptacidiphilus jiangxiensis TaxID=235985 RepID=A0A1H7RH60_STRJI|nr:restriction system protein [Streptacidiphilus jiangxiensis]